MHSFSTKLQNFALSNGLAVLLENVSRWEGREIELSKLEPSTMERLRQSAIITSSVASCAIEGIHVSEDRLEEIDRTQPGTREEREVLNYKRALDFLFQADPRSLAPSPALLRKLHAMTMEGSAHAGQYKQRDNQIVERTPTGDRIRFVPTPAAETPQEVEALFVGYNEVLNKELAPSHVAIACLILGVTCIHPFADGNGRTSRLLTIAALLERGLQMPKYISLEEIIEDRDAFNYQALHASSQGWHTGTYDPSPFIRFHLEVLQAGFQTLHRRVEDLDHPIRVLFSDSLASEVRLAAIEAFRRIYPRAECSAVPDLPHGQSLKIEGYDPNLPKAEFDRFLHAHKFAQKCLGAAMRRVD
jgi:Fic family protein